ncbi:MAG: YggS family pyridoxal phosphate-dependent enzyme [Bacteroidetes bacterium]|nr:YggS family pyridoxal phosphate-dependent enzyme [Bacteroidota bacterium]
MSVNHKNYYSLKEELGKMNVALIAVSKTKPISDILELYELGHRDFGENYVQELVNKAEQLPKDIRWHFIGHLQSNKVKYIAAFVHLIHGVDSLKLLKEINKQGAKENRIIECLLQIHIAEEESKFGFDEAELNVAITSLKDLRNVQINGLMGMASFTEDTHKVKTEFRTLKQIFINSLKQSSDQYKPTVLSMGMSGDYKIAIEEGSTMVRIGSLLFGERDYSNKTS